MLPKQAIRDFQYRKRDDFRAYKHFSEAQLTGMVRKLVEQNDTARPIIWRGLRLPQKVCFLIGARHPRFAFTLDTGCGKTLIAIMLARYRAALGEVHKCLVLVPARINKDEWAREIAKHSPSTKFVVLSGSSAEKWKQVEESDALLYVTTYMGFVRMVTKLVAKKKGKGNKLVLDAGLVERARRSFEGLVLDEAHHVGNEKALFYRVARALGGKTCRMLLELTGTPFGRDPQTTWAQMHLVDGGWSLGETKALFRGVFCTEHFDGWGVEWKFRKEQEATLHRYLAHRSIRYAADKADLPRTARSIKAVALPEDASVFYLRAKRAIREAHGNYRECKNAFIRMRQISSGFMAAIDDDEGERIEIEFASNPKLESLLAYVASIRSDYKFVVFYEFTHSGLRLVSELKGAGIVCEHIYGATRDTGSALARFDHEDTCRGLVLSNRMAEGLNLQTAKYALFYESPVGVIGRKQAERRVERQESKHSTVFIEDFVVDGTADRAILAFHKQGDDLFRAIIEGRVKGEEF